MLRVSKTTSVYDFDLNPPYPRELANAPYPAGYDVRSFPQFDGKNGNASRHLGRFVEALGIYALDRNLRLREFSKSLDGRAYTWYTHLTPGSVRTWEEMAQLFLSKFFDGEQRLTLIDLGRERQLPSEDLVDYVRRFKDKTFDCAEQIPEEDLVNLCIAGMTQVYRIHLENLGIQTYIRLLSAASRTAASVKNAKGDGDRREKRGPLVAAIEGGKKGRFSNENERGDDVAPKPPPFPCSMAKVLVILEQWIKDGVVRLPLLKREPTPEEKASPRYCRFHRNLNHSTSECRTLQKVFKLKMEAGELIFEDEGMDVHRRPFPDRREQGARVNVISQEGNGLLPSEMTPPMEQGLP